MQKTKERYRATKFENHQQVEVHDALAEERALQIHINGKPFTITMRTPGSDPELVTGLLFTEDVYIADKALDIRKIFVEDGENYDAVNVVVHPNELNDQFFQRRSLLSVSSCGICGKKEIEDLQWTTSPLKSSLSIPIQQVSSWFDEMQSAQKIFKHTGGSHAASAFSQNGEMLAIQEDIGRHNAVDKVIGELRINRQMAEASVLLVSGRISYELVNKAHKAQIPVLAAVSAPSSFAVDYANSKGITLLGFCRGSSATCYTWKDRITDQHLHYQKI